MSALKQLATPARAEEVRERLQGFKGGGLAHTLELGDLLAETKANNYYRQWGYGAFRLWVAESGLGISERQAYALTAIVEGQKTLGLQREALIAVGRISLLRELFRLNLAEMGEKVKGLIALGPKLTKEQVKALAGESEGPTATMVFRSFRLLPEAAQIVADAIEHAKSVAGTTTGEDGEPVEISDSRALELIAADYLGSVAPNRV
jgi:hypothetical protein